MKAMKSLSTTPISVPGLNTTNDTVGKDIEMLVTERILSAVLYSDEVWIFYDLSRLLDPEIAEEVEVLDIDHVIIRFRDGRLLDLICLDDYVLLCLEKTRKDACRNACRSLV